MLAKAGVLIAVADLFGVIGREKWARVPLGEAYARRIDSLLGLIDTLDVHEARFSAAIAHDLHEHAGYRAIQALPGVGPTLAAVFVAEIFGRAPVRRPRTPVLVGRSDAPPPRIGHRGAPGAHHKQGSRLVRWAAVEAIPRLPATSKIALDRTRIEERRGRNIAKTAAARKLLTLVYYGLRDGHIHALAHGQTAA